jgi:hypothetical protein
MRQEQSDRMSKLKQIVNGLPLSDKDQGRVYRAVAKWYLYGVADGVDMALVVSHCTEEIAENERKDIARRYLK